MRVFIKHLHTAFQILIVSPKRDPGQGCREAASRDQGKLI